MTSDAPDPLGECRLLTNEVSDLLRLSARSIWREAARGEAGLSSFPVPLRIGAGRLRRWRACDLAEYVSGLAAGGRRP